MCLVRYRPALDRSEGSLPLRTFTRLVDELPELSTITLQGLGEPLLAPDLETMVEYATARGCRVGFNTNATLLTRRRARRLVRAGLSWLHISLDGATPATYESIRDGARFATVEANVRGLVDVKQGLAADNPELSLVFVAMRRNVGELPALVRLAADWGVGRLRVQNLSHSFSDTDPAGSYRQIREFAAHEALWGDGGSAEAEGGGGERGNGGEGGGGAGGVAGIFAEARRLASDLRVDLRLPRVEPREVRPPGTPGCDWPWRSAYVTHEGRVQPCCMLMGGDRAVLGDVTSAPFPAVWRGAAYRDFRDALLTQTPPEVCRGCAMYRGVF
jgi:radical SAM protein with 4Fe4S-binding SPASM domain